MICLKEHYVYYFFNGFVTCFVLRVLWELKSTNNTYNQISRFSKSCTLSFQRTSVSACFCMQYKFVPNITVLQWRKKLNSASGITYFLSHGKRKLYFIVVTKLSKKTAHRGGFKTGRAWDIRILVLVGQFDIFFSSMFMWDQGLRRIGIHNIHGP